MAVKDKAEPTPEVHPVPTTHKGLKFHEDNVPDLVTDKDGIDRIVSTGVKDQWRPNDGTPDPEQVKAAKARKDTH
jgi:hypothetical protein